MLNQDNKNTEGKIAVLVYCHGLNIADVLAFIGPDALKRAAEVFENVTGVPYSEYLQRKEQGEDSYDILSEDDENTDIYLLEPIYCDSKFQINKLLEEML